VIRVFVVDDSAVVREHLQAMLSAQPDIKVIGTAQDPVFALPKMEREWPDVLVLDMEMPRMDGLTFLRQIMAKRPTPTIVCSSLTARGAQISLDALAAGALHIFEKPKDRVGQFLSASQRALIDAVRSAAGARVQAAAQRAQAPKVLTKHTADAVLAPAGPQAIARTTDRIVAIGTSTGGTQALDFLLRELPPDVPGIVVVQHMPEAFTRAFAERLDSISELHVSEARGGERIMAGRALIAPGGKHLLVKRSGAQYFVELADGPPVNRHKPSVDVLFRSVARAAGSNALGVIMTGMGDDGARGLKELLDVGAQTLAQDEKSSVVYGMPKEAVRFGGVQQSLDLKKIPEAIARYGHV
jgi:two-component system, chemotaxis family, protein-glutamate methylesterase/glutaminase